MTDLTGNWTLGLNRSFQRAAVPGSPGSFTPIPPFSYPATGDFTLQAPWVAISTQSLSSNGSWWLGIYCRIQVLLPELEPEAIGGATKIPLNRGARILQIPDWAQAGYQLKFEFPEWHEQLTLEIHLYGGP